MKNITIVNKLAEDKWRQFVEDHPQSNIFHTPEMFQVFDRARGHWPQLWAALDGAGNPLVLWLPTRVTLPGGAFFRLANRTVLYGSVLCGAGSVDQAALSSLLAAYQRQGIGGTLFTECRNLSDLGYLQPVLSEHKFAYEDHLDFLVDLSQSQEVLWRRISKSGRQSIRTARNKGVVVEQVTSKQQLLVGYQLLKKVYARVRVPLADFSLFEAAFDILEPKGMFCALLARIDDQDIGTCFLLACQKTVLYWYTGVDLAFSSYNPGEYLVWQAMQWGQERGCQLFDFGGAGKPDQAYGPRRFKAKFGGDLVNYGRNICVHRPFGLRVSRMGYWVVKKFLFKMLSRTKSDGG